MQLWEKLVQLPDHLLAMVDPIEINLACAEGLPGAEGISRPELCGIVDNWAERVARETARHRICFERDPGNYENSFAYFRMLLLITVLQRDIGVRYNPALIDCTDWPDHDSRVYFVHGVLEGSGACCANLPPVFAAVGRRLGYPLRLITTKGHMFIRWDDPGGERFNIECTSRGLAIHPDEYYLSWPRKVSPEEKTLCCHLKSKSPREELAEWMAGRGECFRHNGKMREAAEAFLWAHELEPENRCARCSFSRAMLTWRDNLAAICPQPFSALRITFPPRRFRQVPKEAEQDLYYLRAKEDLLHDKELEWRFWSPMRQGTKPEDLPKQIAVGFRPT
jgi:hypothetical protein